MKKTFMGVRLRRLRAERGMSQVAMAQALGLSPSYLNQLEQNQPAHRGRATENQPHHGHRCAAVL